MQIWLTSRKQKIFATYVPASNYLWDDRYLGIYAWLLFCPVRSSFVQVNVEFSFQLLQTMYKGILRKGTLDFHERRPNLRLTSYPRSDVFFASDLLANIDSTGVMGNWDREGNSEGMDPPLIAVLLFASSLETVVVDVFK